jgi:hypothetical protein
MFAEECRKRGQEEALKMGDAGELREQEQKAQK